MGGGGGKPLNIFKFNKGDDPNEVINWRLWFAVFSFGIMGAARGMLPVSSTILDSDNFKASTKA
jgi:hypothetical protein